MVTQIINVIVNSKGAVTVARELEAIGASAQRTSTFLNSMRSILASVMTFSGIGRILEAADMFTVLQNRLRQVKEEGISVERSWSRLMFIANSSYSTIDSTVNLYFRVAQAYKAWGRSASEAYEFTDLFQKAAILSGSSVQTTAQAVYQFGQALNKGKLDGDEFRSVLEGLPYVATLIQESLGVTRAELYDFSKRGKISVDEIRKAFENAADIIRRDFGSVTPTIGMAMNVLNNQFTNLVGKIQNSTGVFSYLAKGIMLVAFNLENLAIALAPVIASLVFMAGRMALGFVALALKEMTTALYLAAAAQWVFNAAVAGNPYVLAAIAIAAVVSALYYFSQELGLTKEYFMGLWNSMVSGFMEIYNYIMMLISPITVLLEKYVSWEKIWGAITDAANATWETIKSIFESIVGALAPVVSYIRGGFLSVWKDLSATATNYKNLIYEIVAMFVENWAPAVQGLREIWNDFYKIIEPHMKKLIKFAKDVYDGWVIIANWLSSKLGPIVKDVFDGWIIILRKVIGYVDSLVSALRTAIGLMRQALQGLRGGGTVQSPGAHYGAQFKAEEGFATGGRFKVGGTGAGRDTTPVAFRAERGERVTVETKKQQRQADNSNSTPNVEVPVDVTTIFDLSSIPLAMESRAGRKAIINVISASASEINYVLGK